MNDVKVKAAKLLNSLDVYPKDYGYVPLFTNILALNELGRDWTEIESAVEEQIDLLGMDWVTG